MAVIPVQLATLVQIPIFKGLTKAEFAEFFEIAVETAAAKGATLFREGDKGDDGDDGDTLLIVLEGEVLISRRGVELARLGPNSALGEMSLLGTGEPRSATATALTDLRLYTISGKRFQLLLQVDDLAALKVVANLARVLSRRLTLINDKFVDSRSPRGEQREELADFDRILTRWNF